jgi:hypothetical protein
MSPPTLSRILLFPLLVILHLLFVTLSLILRIYQYLTQTPDALILNTNPPKHVALVLKSTSRCSRRQRKLETLALEESIRRVITWAGQSGVEELSVYNGDGEYWIYPFIPRLMSIGLMKACRDNLIREITRLPISPPSSGASSPPRQRGLSDATNVDTDIESITDGKTKPGEEVISLSTFSHDSELSSLCLNITLMRLCSGSGSSKPLLIHLLPSNSSSSLIPNLTRSYTALSPTQITQQRIATDVKGKISTGRGVQC